MAYVYFHRKADDGKIFYVGIGNQPNHGRAHFVHNRSTHWKRVVAKHGMVAEIFADDISWAEAKEIEIQQIALFGRLDKGSGILINKTDGGDGLLGMVFSGISLQLRSIKMRGRTMTDEHRRKLSLAKMGKKRGPHSQETKKKMSAASVGKPKPYEARQNMRVAQTGKKLSEETKKRIGEAGRGRVKSEETRRRLSVANLGKKGTPKTEEQKQYMREKMKGRKFSQESIEKMKIAARNRNKLHNAH